MKYIKTFEDFVSGPETPIDEKDIKENVNEDTDDINKEEEEDEEPQLQNYMFFQNLKEIKENIDKLLSMDHNTIDDILIDGHDWAADHIATAKDDIDEVTHFLKIHIEESEITDKNENSPE